VAEDLRKPIVISTVYGLFCYVRLYAPEHCIVEAKPPDVDIFDLRLSQPFETLLQYYNNVNFDIEDGMLHGHIPYVAILLKTAKEWQEENGSLPKTM